jgi:uncharacterized protein YndB with AHSA1/START domain
MLASPRVHRNEHSVEIDAPAERVFAYVAEPEHMRKWIGGLIEFRPLDEGPQLGSRAIQVVELSGKKWELESEITRYEPPELLEARLVAPNGFESVASYELEEADGRTRVTTRMTTEYKHRVARLLGGVVTRQAQRKLVSDLERLKQAVEAAG